MKTIPVCFENQRNLANKQQTASRNFIVKLSCTLPNEGLRDFVSIQYVDGWVSVGVCMAPYIYSFHHYIRRYILYSVLNIKRLPEISYTESHIVCFCTCMEA
jgi:hypothetical protein